MIEVIHDNERENRNIKEFSEIAVRQLNFSVDRVIISFVDTKTIGDNPRSDKRTLGSLLLLPDCYKVDIDKDIPSSVQALTICHELIHVNQNVLGRLAPVVDGWTWDGEYYATTSNYSERPWEIEARAKERDLLYSVLKEYRS